MKKIHKKADKVQMKTARTKKVAIKATKSRRRQSGGRVGLR